MEHLQYRNADAALSLTTGEAFYHLLIKIVAFGVSCAAIIYLLLESCFNRKIRSSISYINGFNVSLRGSDRFFVATYIICIIFCISELCSLLITMCQLILSDTSRNKRGEIVDLSLLCIILRVIGKFLLKLFLFARLKCSLPESMVLCGKKDQFLFNIVVIAFICVQFGVYFAAYAIYEASNDDDDETTRRRGSGSGNNAIIEASSLINACMWMFYILSVLYDIILYAFYVNQLIRIAKFFYRLVYQVLKQKKMAENFLQQEKQREQDTTTSNQILKTRLWQNALNNEDIEKQQQKQKQKQSLNEKVKRRRLQRQKINKQGKRIENTRGSSNNTKNINISDELLSSTMPAPSNTFQNIEMSSITRTTNMTTGLSSNLTHMSSRMSGMSGTSHMSPLSNMVPQRKTGTHGRDLSPEPLDLYSSLAGARHTNSPDSPDSNSPRSPMPLCRGPSEISDDEFNGDENLHRQSRSPKGAGKLNASSINRSVTAMSPRAGGLRMYPHGKIGGIGNGGSGASGSSGGEQRVTIPADALLSSFNFTLNNTTVSAEWSTMEADIKQNRVFYTTAKDEGDYKEELTKTMQTHTQMDMSKTEFMDVDLYERLQRLATGAKDVKSPMHMPHNYKRGRKRKSSTNSKKRGTLTSGYNGGMGISMGMGASMEHGLLQANMLGDRTSVSMQMDNIRRGLFSNQVIQETEKYTNENIKNGNRDKNRKTKGERLWRMQNKRRAQVEAKRRKRLEQKRLMKTRSVPNGHGGHGNGSGNINDQHTNFNFPRPNLGTTASEVELGNIIGRSPEMKSKGSDSQHIGNLNDGDDGEYGDSPGAPYNMRMAVSITEASVHGGRDGTSISPQSTLHAHVDGMARMDSLGLPIKGKGSHHSQRSHRIQSPPPKVDNTGQRDSINRNRAGSGITDSGSQAYTVPLHDRGRGTSSSKTRKLRGTSGEQVLSNILEAEEPQSDGDDGIIINDGNDVGSGSDPEEYVNVPSRAPLTTTKDGDHDPIHDSARDDSEIHFIPMNQKFLELMYHDSYEFVHNMLRYNILTLFILLMDFSMLMVLIVCNNDNNGWNRLINSTFLDYDCLITVICVLMYIAVYTDDVYGKLCWKCHEIGTKFAFQCGKRRFESFAKNNIESIYN